MKKYNSNISSDRKYITVETGQIEISDMNYPKDYYNKWNSDSPYKPSLLFKLFGAF